MPQALRPRAVPPALRLSHQQSPAAPGRACLGKPPRARAGLSCWGQLFLGALALDLTFTTRVKDSSTKSLTQKLLILLSSGASQEVSSKTNQKSKQKLKWPETYKEIFLYCLNEIKCSNHLNLNRLAKVSCLTVLKKNTFHYVAKRKILFSTGKYLLVLFVYYRQNLKL